MVLLALLACALASAQEAPVSTAGESIEVRVVNVDVVVTGRNGSPLMELRREDFELYENGKRVEIAYFSHVADGLIQDLTAEELQAAGLTGTALRIPMTWVVYIDQTNILPQRRNQAMRQLRTFLGSAIAAGDRGVIVVYDGRSFQVRQDVTADRPLLMQTLAKIEKDVVVRGEAANRAVSLRTEMNRIEPGTPQAAAMAQALGREIVSVVEEEASRSRKAIAAMGALARALTGMQGRLALLHVGAGFNTVPGLELREAYVQRFGGRGASVTTSAHQADLHRELDRVFTSLSAARVAVYAIHGGAGEGGPTMVEEAGNLQPSAFSSGGRGALTEMGVARQMADRTGGLFFKTSQDLARQLTAVRRDFDNYYSLGYRPAGGPSGTRRIEVKVKIGGARVRHRQDVRPPVAQRAESVADAGAEMAAEVHPEATALLEANSRQEVVPESDRPEELAPEAAPPDDGENALGVTLEVKPATAGFSALDFKLSLQIEKLTFVLDEDEQVHHAAVVTRFDLVAKNGRVFPLETRKHSLSIPDAELADPETDFVDYSWQFDLSPLRFPDNLRQFREGMTLQVTVENPESGRRSIVHAPLRPLRRR